MVNMDVAKEKESQKIRYLRKFHNFEHGRPPSLCVKTSLSNRCKTRLKIASEREAGRCFTPRPSCSRG